MTRLSLYLLSCSHAKTPTVIEVKCLLGWGGGAPIGPPAHVRPDVGFSEEAATQQTVYNHDVDWLQITVFSSPSTPFPPSVSPPAESDPTTPPLPASPHYVPPLRLSPMAGTETAHLYASS